MDFDKSIYPYKYHYNGDIKHFHRCINSLISLFLKKSWKTSGIEDTSCSWFLKDSKISSIFLISQLHWRSQGPSGLPNEGAAGLILEMGQRKPMAERAAHCGRKCVSLGWGRQASLQNPAGQSYRLQLPSCLGILRSCQQNKGSQRQQTYFLEVNLIYLLEGRLNVHVPGTLQESISCQQSVENETHVG